MNKNKKILLGSAILLTSLASISIWFADDNITETLSKWFKSNFNFNQEQREEIKTIIDKNNNGEELTQEESILLNDFNSVKLEKKSRKWMWKKWWIWLSKIDNLTQDEIDSLESMTLEEKKVFFDIKREERKTIKESHNLIIDKLLSWETLTSEEEKIRQDIILERAEKKQIMEEMELKKIQIDEIKTKISLWETLSSEEQELYDTFSSKWFWKKMK